MKKLLKSPVIILVAALVFIGASGVGATRAALVYQSNAESVNFETAQLSVALQEGSLTEEGSISYTRVEDTYEGGKVTSYALTFPSIDKDNFQVGTTYPEYVQVTNTGSYDEYVRLIVTKSWYKDGAKDTTLDPALIELGTEDGIESDWIVQDGPSKEQTIYYLKNPLQAGYSAKLFNSIRVNNTVMEEVTSHETKSADGTYTTITNEYKYNGQSFYIEIEVDAVQTHNAVEAIHGAWGIDVESTEVDGGTITLK